MFMTLFKKFIVKLNKVVTSIGKDWTSSKIKTLFAKFEKRLILDDFVLNKV